MWEFWEPPALREYFWDVKIVVSGWIRMSLTFFYSPSKSFQKNTSFCNLSLHRLFPWSCITIKSDRLRVKPCKKAKRQKAKEINKTLKKTKIRHKTWGDTQKISKWKCNKIKNWKKSSITANQTHVHTELEKKKKHKINRNTFRLHNDVKTHSIDKPSTCFPRETLTCLPLSKQLLKSNIQTKICKIKKE